MAGPPDHTRAQQIPAYYSVILIGAESIVTGKGVGIFILDTAAMSGARYPLSHYTETSKADRFRLSVMMKPIPKIKTRALLDKVYPLLLGLTLAAVLGIGQLGPLADGDLKLMDLAFRLRGPQSVPPENVILAIDEDSFSWLV